MDIIQKELQSRRGEIKKSLEMLFKTNMKITDWDIPEADDKKVAQTLVDMMQEELDELKSAIKNGKYDNY
jgi:hypothetical protein